MLKILRVTCKNMANNYIKITKKLHTYANNITKIYLKREKIA
jgi:hypothetical protein